MPSLVILYHINENPWFSTQQTPNVLGTSGNVQFWSGYYWRHRNVLGDVRSMVHICHILTSWSDVLGTSWRCQKLGPDTSVSDVQSWRPGDVLWTSGFWSNLGYLLTSYPDVSGMSMDVIHWHLILTSQWHSGDVRTMVSWMSFTNVQFWHPEDILWTSEHWLGICHLMMSTGRRVDVKSLVSYMSLNDVSFWRWQDVQWTSGLLSGICHILASIPDVLGTYLDVGS